ncbi:HAD-IIIA family hydrolase [Phocaeicola vulgatus]|uniref:KdsC family phosphatase n=1 Tax=Phocaeicola vulgatus TaxID=821 RepID=UPI0039B42623
MLPKLILTDIDGVWTDGGMYYDQTGNEWKRFCTYDSAGVLLAHHNNIPVGILTGENTKIVQRRADKLCVDYIYQGVRNKFVVAKELCDTLGISLNEVAYIGDDFIDLELLNNVGWSAAPLNAHPIVKESVDYVTTCKGGEGAFRDFVENLIRNNGGMCLY